MNSVYEGLMLADDFEPIHPSLQFSYLSPETIHQEASLTPQAFFYLAVLGRDIQAAAPAKSDQSHGGSLGGHDVFQ